MELSFAQAAALAPVGIGGVALAATIHEAGDGETKRAGALGAGVASLSALAAFLLSLPPATSRTHTLVALAIGTCWLAGRCRADVRLGPALLASVGLVAGLSPLVGVALVPLTFVAIGRLLDDARPARAVLRALAVVVIAGLVGVLVGDPASRVLPRGSTAHGVAWLASASHGAGVAAVAVAALGLLLGVVGPAPRRALSFSALLLAAGEICAGALGPLSCLAIAIGVGVALLEAAGRASRVSLRGATALVAPLACLVLAEPLSARLHTESWAIPDLGPVPPHRSHPAPARTDSVHRPSERSL